MYSKDILELIHEGSKAYSGKNYDLATSKFADACSAFNKEHNKDCPDLLLLYGKALFQSGVTKSGVLGGISTQPVTSRKEDDDENDENDENFEEGMANEELEIAAEQDEEEDKETENEERKTEADSESEPKDERTESQDEDEEEQSEFEAAWDILDLARALFEERVSGLEGANSDLSMPYLKSDDEEPTNEYVINLKKLSETYDLLGEVSLESENFSQAAADLESCLKLRQKMYDSKLSSSISESHYKLSLALEFSEEDELRSKAADHVRQAMNIVKARDEQESDKAHKEDNAQLLQELAERYEELKRNPEQQMVDQQMNIIKGILGEATSESSNASKFVTAVQSKVNDLSSMVKKRKAQPSGPGKKQKKE